MDWKLKLQVIWDNWLEIWDRFKHTLGFIVGVFEILIGLTGSQPVSVVAGFILLSLTWKEVTQDVDFWDRWG